MSRLFCFVCRRSQRNLKLVPFNPEIEAAARRRRSEARRGKEATVLMAEQKNRVLRDYALP